MFKFLCLLLVVQAAFVPEETENRLAYGRKFRGHLRLALTRNFGSRIANKAMKYHKVRIGYYRIYARYGEKALYKMLAW